MINPPEGAIKSIAELRKLVDEARENETCIPIWRLYPMMTHEKRVPTGLRKRWITSLSMINATHRVMTARNDHGSIIDVPLGAVGENPIVSNAWYFTNYWMAWAHLQRVRSSMLEPAQ